MRKPDSENPRLCALQDQPLRQVEYPVANFEAGDVRSQKVDIKGLATNINEETGSLY